MERINPDVFLERGPEEILLLSAQQSDQRGVRIRCSHYGNKISAWINQQHR